MDVKNTHSVTKTEISVFGRQALDAERRRSPSLADKVLREQFLHSCQKDMAMFLKVRAPVDQKSMLDLAINYEWAHKYVGYEEAQPISNQGGMRKCSDIPRYRHPQSNRHSFSPFKGYRCNKVGHRANECRQTNNKPSQRDYHLTNSHGIANAGVTSLTHCHELLGEIIRT